jgi:S-formylglutathione hydrolase
MQWAITKMRDQRTLPPARLFMKLRDRTFAALMVVAVAICVSAGPHGQVIQITVHSPALEHNHVKDSSDRAASIYLPPDYEAGMRRYPVLYLLHGYTGTDRGWMNPNYVGLPALMDQLLQRHTIQSMIVVMPNSFNRFGGSFYSNSVLSGDWEDFIVRDLVDYVDTHYRTIAEASSRGIAGHSMGGYGALRLGMEHPDVFSSAYGMSPCCSYWDEQEDKADVVKAQQAKTLQEIVEAGMGPQSVLALAAAFSPDLANPPFGVDWPFDAKGHPISVIVAKWQANLLDQITAKYAAGTQRLHALGFDVGRQDENHDILIGSKRLDQQMTKLGISHEYSEYDGTHSSRVGEQVEKVVLPFMSKALGGDSSGR